MRTLLATTDKAGATSRLRPIQNELGDTQSLARDSTQPRARRDENIPAHRMPPPPTCLAAHQAPSALTLLFLDVEDRSAVAVSRPRSTCGGSATYYVVDLVSV